MLSQKGHKIWQQLIIQQVEPNPNSNLELLINNNKIIIIKYLFLLYIKKCTELIICIKPRCGRLSPWA